MNQGTLTFRQIEVIQALADGREPKQLAHRRATIHQILLRARTRASCKTTWELIAFGFRKGLIK